MREKIALRQQAALHIEQGGWLYRGEAMPDCFRACCLAQCVRNTLLRAVYAYTVREDTHYREGEIPYATLHFLSPHVVLSVVSTLLIVQHM